MAFTKFLVCLFALFTATLAAKSIRTIEVIESGDAGFPGEEPTPKPKGKIVNIVEEFIPATVTRDEFSDFTSYSSESGVGRITRVGLNVNRGAYGTLYFDIVVKAIDAETLQKNDKEFEATLSAAEKSVYRTRKASWKKGLDIPLFKWIGADFDKKVTTESFTEEAASQENYTEKVRAASQLLENSASTKIRISGSLKATGISFRPTVAFAFIKLARVTFEDGSSQLIVSNNPEDVVAGTSGGDVLPSEDPVVDVTCDAGFYCN
ncbi:unnamed protein product [Chondrus crispus]|uniref:SEA domain-containing protein n=1 Tax=Chondrus crispus TaxID=2769 RepID=R7QE18_CHOCR|nr:unnamed protein product [Chondrus crispus]CDF35675.1 unnamed protein product [Chondrus crispus]|eukprot:XP_005715494.1 unnamed protein product [Chondrus crispus]